MTTTQTIEEPEFRGRERLAASYAFLWFFMMMSGYNVLRPIRETLVTSLDNNEKSTLFLMTFLVMLGAAPIYAWLVSKLTRTQLLHAVMHFFASNLVLFAVWDSLPIPSATLWLARVYFVWVSVFSLFVTSVFWSVLADVFRNEQGTRLFGPIASGGTIGAIVGSFVTGRTAELFSHTQLFWSVAVLLEFGLVFAVMLTFVTRNGNLPSPKFHRQPKGFGQA